jgi:FMN-dependent NADH-azoreductase
VAEIQAADEIVVATPMYNFAVPAALKAKIIEAQTPRSNPTSQLS